MTAFSYSIFAKGGPVMWLLLLLGLTAVVIFIERALFLHRGQIRSTEFLNGIQNLLQKNRLMEALTVCEETPGPVAKNAMNETMKPAVSQPRRGPGTGVTKGRAQ